MVEKTVETVVLDADAPGGSVYGVDELAAKLQAAGNQKYVIASVNLVAVSAGYDLAAQASEVVATPSDQVGSIGKVLSHLDVADVTEGRGEGDGGHLRGAKAGHPRVRLARPARPGGDGGERRRLLQEVRRRRTRVEPHPDACPGGVRPGREGPGLAEKQTTIPCSGGRSGPRPSHLRFIAVRDRDILP